MFRGKRRRNHKLCRISDDSASPESARYEEAQSTHPPATSSPDKLEVVAERIAERVGQKLERQLAETLAVTLIADSECPPDVASMIDKLGDAVLGRFDAAVQSVEERMLAAVRDHAKEITTSLQTQTAAYSSELRSQLEEAWAGAAQTAQQRALVDALISLYDRVQSEAAYQSLWYSKDSELTGHIGCRQLQERFMSASRSYAAEILMILNSVGVEVIVAGAGRFDPKHQRVVGVEPAPRPELDGQIVCIQRRGFAANGRILRPEDVVVYKWEANSHDQED
jgi:molecular chaperone GrpE (heat shock protein)